MRLSTTLNLYTLRRGINHLELAPKAVRVLKDAGYDDIDVMLKEVASDFPRAEQDRWAEEVGQAMADAEIKATQCHGFFCSTRLLSDAEIAGAYRDKIVRSIALASRLGITDMVIHPLTLAESRSISFEEELDINASFFRSLADTLEKNHVCACFENLPHSSYDRAESLLLLREEIGMPDLFAFCWDTGHAHLVEGVRDRQAEEIRSLGPLLHATHIQDNHGQKDEHLLPMTGTIDWPPIVTALLEGGFRGDFTYETAQNVNYLPDDDILRTEMISYSVHLGRYLIGHPL